MKALFSWRLIDNELKTNFSILEHSRTIRRRSPVTSDEIGGRVRGQTACKTFGIADGLGDAGNCSSESSKDSKCSDRELHDNEGQAREFHPKRCGALYADGMCDGICFSFIVLFPY